MQIYLIFTIVILLLIIIFTSFKLLNKKESYQPVKVGKDVYKYLILPELSLKELTNFALTSQDNLRVVNNYLQTFINPPSLSELNRSIYFSEINIPHLQVLIQKIKEQAPFRQDFLINAEAISQYQKTKIPTVFSLNKIKELFRLLGTRYQGEITKPETEEQEKVDISLIDGSNLPLKIVTYPFYDVTAQYFTPLEIKDKDFLIKIIKKGREDAISIQIFIRSGTNIDFEQRLERFRRTMNAEIDPFLLTGQNPYKNIYVIKRDVKGPDRKTIEGQTFNFDFNGIKILNPNEGYDLFKKFYPKKRGKDFIIEEIEEKE